MADPTAALPESELEAEQSTEATLPGGVPWLTYGIIAVCSAIFAYLNLGTSTAAYGRVTAVLIPANVEVWNGAYWGFLTTAFVHFEVMHILFNMWWARDFGRLIEPALGRPRYLLFVLGAAIFSTSAELLVSGTTCIGYSGVVYALFGYALVARHVVPVYQRLLTRQTIQWMLGWLVLCFVLSALGIWRIANYAHLGGLVFGCLVGKAFAARTHVKASLVGLGALGALTILSAVAVPWSDEWRDRAALGEFYTLRRQAETGDPEAQYRFGSLLLAWTETKIEGLDWLRKAAGQGEVSAMNGLAWQLATDPESNVRNGPEALRWAERACQQRDWKDATYIDTLAAAYAELNRWDEAVTTQRQAIDALTADQTKYRAGFEDRLEKYSRQEKFRELTSEDASGEESEPAQSN